jgi:hypothetical protein
VDEVFQYRGVALSRPFSQFTHSSATTGKPLPAFARAGLLQWRHSAPAGCLAGNVVITHTIPTILKLNGDPFL